MGATFLPFGLGALGWIAFVPLLVVLDARLRSGASIRGAAGLGYLFGFVFFLIGTHWIAMLNEVAITVPWLKYPAWVAAAAYLAIFPALGCAMAVALARHARVGLALTFPLAFLVAEELRASGEMGFPWFQPGYSQWAFTPLIQMASLGSVTLVTLWLLVLNILIWRTWRGEARLRAALGVLLMIALPLLWGRKVIAAAPAGEGPRVALVQANIPGEIKWAGTHEREILATFLRLSGKGAATAPRPDLVIWPETATGSWMRKRLDQTLEVSGLAARTGVPIFSGFADYDYASADRMLQRNSAGLFTTDGSLGPTYAKRHLVPFGERMPFQGLIPALGRIELGQAEWTPGERVVLFPSPGGPFACLICFESIFPDLSREAVRAGATWLVNITNDEWFGRSAALEQHAAMAVFRAVENRVPVARCANTGLSWIIDSRGRITAAAPAFTEAVVTGVVSTSGPPTPFTRLGDWPGVACGTGVVLLSALAVFRALTARAKPS
ncbi:MAG: apolipoprotein N-acyltransferase [Candidatus Eisenbacteria bacterium]